MSRHGGRSSFTRPQLNAWESYDQTAKAARAISRKEVLPPKPLLHEDPVDAGLNRRSFVIRPRHNKEVIGWSTYAETAQSARDLRPRRQSEGDVEAGYLSNSRHNKLKNSLFLSEKLLEEKGKEEQEDEEAIAEMTQQELMRVDMFDDVVDIFGVYFSAFTNAELKNEELNWWQLIFSLANATMPWLQDDIQRNLPLPKLFIFVELCFRGIGQVYFQNNPISGFLILIGLYVQSSRIATHGVIAIVTGNFVALALGFDRGLINSGLFGYNAFLVGLALATFNSTQQNTGWDGAIIFAVIVAASFSSVLFVVMGKLLVPYKSPPLTLPFNVATIVLILATAYMNRVQLDNIGTPTLPDYSIVDVDNGSWGLREVLVGTMRGMGQVFLADNIVTACLVFAGIAVCSRISALAAFAGSLLGALMAIAAGVPIDDVEFGFYGFNCSLTVTAIFMFYSPSAGVLVLAIISGILTVLAQFAFATLFLPYALPFMTLPFCAGALPLIIIQGTTKRVVAVPLSSMTVPEDHAARVQTINRGFRLLKATISPDSVNTWALAKKSASLHKYQPWKKISDMKKEAYVENCSADLFQIVDVNQQGHITLEQFVGTLAAADLTDEAGIAFAEKAFDLVNGGSKTMTEETFVKFANISCCLRRVGIQLAKFFAFVDVDRSGTIDFDEFDAAREYLGQPALSEAERKNLMALSRCYAPSGQFEFDVTDMTTIVLLDYIKTLIAADTYKRSVLVRSTRTKWHARSTSELTSSH